MRSRHPAARLAIALLALPACAPSDVPAAGPQATRVLDAAAHAALPALALADAQPVCPAAPESCHAGALGIVAVREDGAVAFGAEGRTPQVMLVEDGTPRPIGRAGGGPGEYRAALGLAFTADGGLEVLDWFQRRLVRFARDGAPAGESRVALPAGLITPAYAGDSLRAVATDLEAARGDSAPVIVVAIADDDTPVLQRLPRHERALAIDALRAPPGPFAAIPRWVLAPDGRALFTPGDPWRLDVYARDGTHLVHAGFDAAARAVSDDEYARERDRRLGTIGNARMREAAAAQMGPKPSHHAPITDLRALHDGRLWVREVPRAAEDSVPWVVLAADGTAEGRLVLATEDLPVAARGGLTLLSTDTGLRWVRVVRGP